MKKAKINMQKIIEQQSTQVPKIEVRTKHWTLEELNKLENDITKLYQTSELSIRALQDVMSRIEFKRDEINKTK